jgi:hypothetical protein
MSRNIIKNLWLAAMLTAVLGAGTLSAQQLRSAPNGFACGTTCSVDSAGHVKGCSDRCFCNLGSNGTGFCSGNPQLSRSPGK